MERDNTNNAWYDKSRMGKKIRITSEDVGTIVFLVLVIGFLAFWIISGITSGNKGNSSYGSDCDEEWDTHGHHHKVCDRDYSEDVPDYDDRYDDYDLQYERNLERYQELEDEYYSRQYD